MERSFLIGKVYWAQKFMKAKSGKWDSAKADNRGDLGVGGVCTPGQNAGGGENGGRTKYIGSTDSGLPRARTQ